MNDAIILIINNILPSLQILNAGLIKINWFLSKIPRDGILWISSKFSIFLLHRKCCNDQNKQKSDGAMSGEYGR